MLEAEFTHAGDSCSFEVLLARVACTAIFRAGANRLVPYARTKPLLLAGWTDESVRRRIEGELGARAIAIMSAVIVWATI
jgi:hypothetical protein